MKYDDWNELLRRANGGRGMDRKKVANNTWVVQPTSGDIYVRLHGTDILRYYADGRIEVNTGGWNTTTTLQRINAYLPDGIRVGTVSGEPFIYVNGEQFHMHRNGATISADGTVWGVMDPKYMLRAIADGKRARARELRAARKQINLERKCYKTYHAVRGLFLTACGAESWEVRNRMTRALDWLARYDVKPYVAVDGYHYVDLYKGVVDDHLSMTYAPDGSRTSYEVGTTPACTDWDPSPECGGGLHLCANVGDVSDYVNYHEIVRCPVRVDEIVVIGWPDEANKCKVPRVARPIYEYDDVR